MLLYPTAPEAAKRFLTFINASPTPFHAVQNAVARLESAGFQRVGTLCSDAISQHDQYAQVREIDDWEKDIKPRGKYYFTRYHDLTLCSVLDSSFYVPPETSPPCSHLPFLRTGNRVRASPSWQLTWTVLTCA